MADATESEKDRFNRFRDSFAKDISERQKVMTSLTTMATALLALPLLFFKDIFRETVRVGDTLIGLISRQHAIVSGAAYLGWFALIATIFLGLVYTMRAGMFLHNLYKYDHPGIYLNDDGGEAHRAWLEMIFDCAVYAFMIGFVLMMFFILSYAKTTIDVAR